MNKAKLTSLCHKVSRATGLSFNSVLTHYFLESVLGSIAKGPYNENFIFKGGFLLSNIVGIESRSTIDIDFILMNMELSEGKVLKILRESLTKNNDEGLKYEIRDILPIKEDDRYGGFRVNIICKLENIKLVIPLDIAAGDVITPHPVDYTYNSVFNEEKIKIKAYPIETMLAEMIQTIYSRGFLNSRSKDYYDLYIIYKLRLEEINKETLLTACERTFRFRETEFNLSKIIELLKKLKEDEDLRKRWEVYANKNLYVQDISFEIAINSALKLITEMKD